MDNSIKLEDLQSIEQIEKNLNYPLNYINYPEYELSQSQFEKVSHGNPIQTDLLLDGIVIFTYQGKLVAMADVSDKIAKVSKVFI